MIECRMSTMIKLFSLDLRLDIEIEDISRIYARALGLSLIVSGKGAILSYSFFVRDHHALGGASHRFIPWCSREEIFDVFALRKHKGSEIPRYSQRKVAIQDAKTYWLDRLVICFQYNLYNLPAWCEGAHANIYVVKSYQLSDIVSAAIAKTNICMHKE